MLSINLDFNKLNNYKKNDFKIKKIKIINSFNFVFFAKQDVSLNKKRLKFIYFKLFKQFESLSSFLPKIFKVTLKYTNKKKKLKTKSFVKIKICIKKKVLKFFDNFFVKYLYLYLKSLENLKKKKFVYLQEIITNRFNTKIRINCRTLSFKMMLLKNCFDFSKTFYRKSKAERYKENVEFIKKGKYKFINLKVFINSKFINYFFSLIFLFVINNYKINLFFQKKYFIK